MLRALNLDGDGQVDLNAHGGVHKAAYAYSIACRAPPGEARVPTA